MTENAKPRRKARAKSDFFYAMTSFGGSNKKPGFFWGTTPVDWEADPSCKGKSFTSLDLPAGPYPPPPRTGYLDPTIGTGLPADYKPEPLIIDLRCGRAPSDIEPWLRDTELVSDRTKQLLESFDAGAFQFWPLEVVWRDADGTRPGTAYWIMDVVRHIDAVDRSQPGFKMTEYDNDTYSVDFPSGGKALFDATAIGPARVFRLSHRTQTVLCDGEIRTAIVKARLTGFMWFLKGVKQ